MGVKFLTGVDIAVLHLPYYYFLLRTFQEIPEANANSHCDVFTVGLLLFHVFITSVGRRAYAIQGIWLMYVLCCFTFDRLPGYPDRVENLGEEFCRFKRTSLHLHFRSFVLYSSTATAIDALLSSANIGRAPLRSLWRIRHCALVTLGAVALASSCSLHHNVLQCKVSPWAALPIEKALRLGNSVSMVPNMVPKIGMWARQNARWACTTFPITYPCTHPAIYDCDFSPESYAATLAIFDPLWRRVHQTTQCDELRRAYRKAAKAAHPDTRLASDEPRCPQQTREMAFRLLRRLYEEKLRSRKCAEHAGTYSDI